MEVDVNDFYNLNGSLREQVKYLTKDYSKLKAIIKTCEATSKRLSNNIGPLKSKLSGLNSFSNSVLRKMSNGVGRSLVSALSGDSGAGNFANNMMRNIMGARATGGNVSQNVPYIVGERGPELFTPTSAGHITPNNATQSGKQISVVMNINAPDISSFQRSESQLVKQVTRAMRKASRPF